MANISADTPFTLGPFEALMAFNLGSLDGPTGVTTVYVTPPAAAVPPAPISTIPKFVLGGLAAQTGFGSDVLVFPGLDPNLTLVNDGRVVAEALARRLSTPRGSLPFHPDYGLDLRGYLNDAMTPERLYQLRAAAELECEQDERVQSAEVKASFSLATQSLRVSINVTTNTGDLRFVLNVSQVSVDLLSQE